MFLGDDLKFNGMVLIANLILKFQVDISIATSLTAWLANMRSLDGRDVMRKKLVDCIALLVVIVGICYLS